MRIAYLTTDEVNEHLALQMAARAGAIVHPWSFRDPPLNGQFDAVVYDLDYLPAEQRAAIVARLLSGPTDCRVAVHTYNLAEEQITRLHERGILVFRKLGTRLFVSLSRPSGPKRLRRHRDERTVV